MNSNVPQQATIEFAPDRSTAGFRLHECAVFNWGTFHGSVCRFRPGGRTALLTGANGAGKSTLADAVLTLFIDSRKRNYNQASAGGGDRKTRKERSERDYILGTHSEKHDADRGVGRPQQLRKPGEAVSILLAHFYNETFNTHVTLAQALWVTPSGKVDRAYIVARQKLSIEGDLHPESLGGPSEIRQRLRERALEPVDTFAEYSRRFHEALFLDYNKSPMDIFNQAICIKDISDLTSFIRQYMLDDGGAARKLTELRANFDELHTIYQRIEREKKRLEQLNHIRSHHEDVCLWKDSIDRWNLTREAATLYFAEREIALRTGHGQRISLDLSRVENQKMRDEKEAADQSGLATELQIAIASSEAGRRLQAIEKEIDQHETEVQQRKPRNQRFHTALRQWRPHASVDSERNFNDLLAAAAKELPQLREQAESIAAEILQTRHAITENQQQQQSVSDEIRHLLESKGNIPRKNALIRERLAAALNVPAKQLPFAGELLQVRDRETRWTGAIERLARGLGLSILVPEKLRAAVDDHVHQTDQQGLIVYHAVGKMDSTAINPAAPNSVAAKLEIHADAGAFGVWLQQEINHRFGHECHNEPNEDFHRAQKALTVNGLIKQSGSERRKDDRHGLHDHARHILGWDNTAKIEALENKQRQLRETEAGLNGRLKTQHATQANIEKRIEGVKALQSIAAQWVEIDFATPAAKIEELRVEAANLRQSSSQLNDLKARHKEAETKAKQARERVGKANERIGEIKREMNDNQTAIDQVARIIDSANAREDAGQACRDRYSEIQEMLGIPVTAIPALNDARRSTEKAIEEKAAQARSKHAAAQTDAKHAMRDFVEKLRAEEPRLHDELYNEDLHLPGYNDTLFDPFEAVRRRIEEEDLPKNQERFERLLQNNLIEDVANFDGLLGNHADTIKRRIAALNRHLQEVDFDRTRQTYIQLIPTPNNSEAQKRFLHLRKYALENSAHIGESDQERREAFARVKHLIDELGKDERWTQRVIDVRNWFDFRADEFFRQGDEYCQTYSGASGKSGGEKNRLASTILATSIAYQYGISIDDERQSDTFRLVVVDEMFSKTDDEFSTYLLDLFKQFHLQLIIIQPLDSKIHLVEKYVERYHIVTRPNAVSNIKDLTVAEYQSAMKALAES